MEAQPAPGFSDYLNAIGRRRALLLGIALPIAALAVLLAVGLPDIYHSSALIEIDEQTTKRTGELVTQPGDTPSYADQYVQSLKGIVLTDANLRELIRTYGLYPEHKEDEAAALRRLRRDIEVAIVTTPILDPRTGREREVVAAFTLAHDSRSPAKAQQVARWLVDSFLAEHRRQRQSRAASAAEFFGNEAERMRTRVTGLEAKLAEFKRDNFGRLPELTEVNMSMMDRTERDLEQMQLQAQTLRQERVFLVSQLEQTRSAGPDAGNLQTLEAEYKRKSTTYDESHPDMVSLRRQVESLRSAPNAGAGSLNQQLAAKRSVLTETRQRYSDDHPDVKQLKREISALEARIASGESANDDPGARSPVAMQLQTQINAIDTQLAGLAARSAELRGKLRGLEGNVVSAPQVEREYQTVTRDLTIARTKYEELLNRQMDAEVSEAAIAGGRADEFRLIQSPLKPSTPEKPKRMAILLFGLIMAVVLGLSSAVVAEGLDGTVRGAHDIRDVLAVSPLVAIPSIRNSIARRRAAWRFAAASLCAALGVWIAFTAVQMWL